MSGEPRPQEIVVNEKDDNPLQNDQDVQGSVFDDLPDLLPPSDDEKEASGRQAPHEPVIPDVRDVKNVISEQIKEAYGVDAKHVAAPSVAQSASTVGTQFIHRDDTLQVLAECGQEAAVKYRSWHERVYGPPDIKVNDAPKSRGWPHDDFLCLKPPPTPLQRRLKQHRYKPRKSWKQRKTPEGYAYRQALHDQKCRAFTDRENAARLKRLRVEIEYEVPVRDEANTQNLGWSVRLTLTAPAPNWEVDPDLKKNRFVQEGKDWWNNPRQVQTAAYIQMLHTGEADGGRATVIGERVLLRQRGLFIHVDEARRRDCEKISCIRWARSLMSREAKDADVCEYILRMYMVGCVHFNDCLLQTTEVHEDFVPLLRESSAEFKDCEAEDAIKRLTRILPTFNTDLRFNPITRRLFHRVSDPANFYIRYGNCAVDGEKVSVRKWAYWFFTNLPAVL